VADLPDFPTVTAPLAWWAGRHGERTAIAGGSRRLSFGALDRAVRCRAGAIAAERAPAVIWVRDAPNQSDRLVDFCAIVETGRAASVADPSWPPGIRASVAGLLPAAPPPGPPGPGSAFYVGFTSGSTGLPKGFSRDHRSWTESFAACLSAFGPEAGCPIVAPGSLSHSLFLFAMLLGLWTGAGVHVQDRFSAPRCLDTLAGLDSSCLVAVPSQLMLLAASAERRGKNFPGVKLILISGARWARPETPRIRALFPQARIVEFYGASETSFIAWTDSDPALPATAVGQPFAGVDISIRGGAPGLIFVRSPMLFTGYLLGDDGLLLRDGDWISVRDMGFRDAAGLLHLVGREARMIVTQGKKVFAEEVETVLERHPGIAAASVLGLPDPVRGHALAALLWPSGGAALDPAQIAASCSTSLPAFKIPRTYAVAADWPRTASGKTDHAALAARFDTATRLRAGGHA
jgi:long-chain acyl-CoA synthetase